MRVDTTLWEILHNRCIMMDIKHKENMGFRLVQDVDRCNQQQQRVVLGLGLRRNQQRVRVNNVQEWKCYAGNMLELTV